MSDIAAARVFSHREEKVLVAATFMSWVGIVGMGNIGFRRSGRGGNDKKDLQKRINFKRGGRSRRIGVYLGREGLGHGGKPP